VRLAASSRHVYLFDADTGVTLQGLER
jgi:hypothetical protein